MVAKIGGKRLCQWRAVDNDGEVIGALLQKRRNKAADRPFVGYGRRRTRRGRPRPRLRDQVADAATSMTCPS